jgi:hypothetical protein
VHSEREKDGGNDTSIPTVFQTRIITSVSAALEAVVDAHAAAIRESAQIMF